MARPMIDREATAEQLLEACEELIRQRGAVEITITDIAAACGMSQSNVYRFFPSKDALYEAIAERWFREIMTTSEDVVAADLPAPEKMFEFFARNLAIKLSRYEADPALFLSYLALGDEHHEVVHGFVDLHNHYLSMIVGQAIADGYFVGKSVDEVVALTGIMTGCFTKPHTIVEHRGVATRENLRQVIDVIFAGLGEREPARPALRLAS